MTYRDASLVDLHTHLMPGVDDGVPDAGEVREALEALARAGVLVAAATPHLRASVLAEPDAAPARLAELDAAWGELRAVAEGADDLPAVLRGAEVRLDAPDPDLSDPRVRLAGSDAVLVEFASLELPPYGAEQLREVVAAGWRPVLAHAERYRGLGARIGAAGRWKEAGAALQVNAGSLLGHYGDEARRVGWELLERGWVDLLASDYHGVGPVALDAAAARVRARGGGGPAGLLVGVNPRRLSVGDEPKHVPPLPERGWLDRLLGLFR